MGRDLEVAALCEIVHQRTSAHVAALVGAAGVGKSALTRAGVSLTSRTILEGRATPDGVALRVLAEIAVAAVVSGAQVDHPDLGALRGGIAALLPGSGDAELGGAVFPLVTAEALLALVETIDGPCTLVLDDLQWADRDTLDAIERICDRVVTRSVTLVLITRPQCPAEQLVRRLGSRRVASVIDVQPLDGETLAAMTAACLGAPAPVGLVQLLEAAAGMPYHVEELLRTAYDAGALTSSDDGWSFDRDTPVPPPATISDSIALRLSQLPKPCARFLSIVAALGEGQPLEAIAAAADMSNTDELHGAIRAGIDAQLLDSSSGDICFRHALTAEAAAALLLPHERRDAAAKALATLTANSDLARRVDHTALATLAKLAGDNNSAARWRLAAARQHAATAATASAITELEHALALVHDPALLSEIRVEYVELLALAGRDGDALAQAEVAAASPNLDIDEAIRVDLATARCAGAAPARFKAIERALTHARGRPIEPRVSATAALLAVERGEHHAAVEHATRALDIATNDPTAKCQALEVLGRVARGRDLDEAHALFKQAAAVAQANGLALWRARALHEGATITQLRDGEVTDLQSARAAAIDAGAPGLIAAIDFHLAAVLATRFDGPDAVVAARRFVDLSSALGNRAGEAWGWVLVGYANVVSGRWNNAAPALAEGARLHPDDTEIRTLSQFFNDGLSRLLQADLDGAIDGYQRAMTDLSENSPAPSPLTPWYMGPLLATVMHGGDIARGQADRSELQVASVCRSPWLMAEAVAAGQRSDPAAANTLVARADSLWDAKPGLDGQRHLSRWLASPAANRDGWGNAHTWLFDAETWATTLGFDRIADACRGELRATGATPKRRRGTTRVPEGFRRLGMTSREVDVLRLLSEGMTNADIAGRLHVSPGTVKGYVSQLLTKTGAKNRAGLARIASDHDIRDDPEG